jgi:hypothetical protein
VRRALPLVLASMIGVLLQSSVMAGVAATRSLGIVPLNSLADRHSERPTSQPRMTHRLKPPRAQPSGRVLFDGAGKAGWADQSAAPTRVSSEPDPSDALGRVLRFDVFDGDVYPLTPTDNPRAQLTTPSHILHEGQPFWETYEVYVPKTFPKAETYGSWIQLGSPFYGPPYDGPPSVSMEIEDGRFLWQADAHSQVPGSILWQAPVVTGKWIRFTWHVDPTPHGHVELYVNDRPVFVRYNGHKGNGVTIPVVDASNETGPWFSQLSVYYGRGQFSALTLYFKGFAIATTQGAAEGVV